MIDLFSCEFNMTTACAELKFTDGSIVSIDTIAVENEVANNMYERSELEPDLQRSCCLRRFDSQRRSRGVSENSNWV